MVASVQVPSVPRLSVPEERYSGLPRPPPSRGALQQAPRTLLHVTRSPATTGGLPTLARNMVMPLSVPTDDDAEFAPVGDDGEPVPGSDPIPLPATEPTLSSSLLDRPLLDLVTQGLRAAGKALKRVGGGAWPKRAAAAAKTATAAAKTAAAKLTSRRARAVAALLAVVAVAAVVLTVSRLVSTLLSLAAVAVAVALMM